MLFYNLITTYLKILILVESCYIESKIQNSNNKIDIEYTKCIKNEGKVTHISRLPISTGYTPHLIDSSQLSVKVSTVIYILKIKSGSLDEVV